MPDSEHRLRNAAMVFKMLGSDGVLFKGGHGEGPSGARRAVDGGEFIPFEAPRQDTRHTHGTGCTLATAIACGLAQKLPLTEAVARAHAYVQQAIRTAPGLGAGSGPLLVVRNNVRIRLPTWWIASVTVLRSVEHRRQKAANNCMQAHGISIGLLPRKRRTAGLPHLPGTQ